MSRSIDERIVEMRFNNKEFEAGVQQSLNSIEKLNQGLRFNGAKKGLDAFSSSSLNTNISGIAAGIGAIQDRFSALGIVGMRVIENITDSIMQLSKRMTSFVTDGIIQGGMKRVLNVEQARFQLKGLLEDTKMVQGVMKLAQESVSDTAYTYGEAANAASMFVASGIKDDEKLINSLNAVADTAAATNSDYQSMAQIFTTVAGNGRLMGDQLLQLSSRGTNAAALIAKYLNETGKASNATEADIRDMVSKGKIDFEMFANAMEYTFGGHAKHMDNTFTGVSANIRAALARIGEGFLKLDDQTTLFTEKGPIVKFLQAIKSKINEANEALTPLQNMFYHFADNSLSKMTKLVEAFDIKKPIETFTNWFIKLKESMDSSSKTGENLKNTFGGIKAAIHIVVTVFSSLLKVLSPVKDGLSGIGDILLSVTGKIGEWLIGVDKGVTELSNFDKAVSTTTGVVDTLKNVFDTLKGIFSKVVDSLGIFAPVIKAIGEAINNVCERIKTALSNIGLDEFVNGAALTGLIMMVKEIVGMFRDVTAKGSAFVSNINKVIFSLSKGLQALEMRVQASVIKDIAVSVAILAGACLILSTIDAKSLAKSLGAVTVAIGELIGSIKLITGELGIKQMIALNATVDAIRSLAEAILIFAGALKLLSTIDNDKMIGSLVAITVIIAEAVGACVVMSKYSGEIKTGAVSIIAFAIAITILADAVKKLAELDTDGLTKGLIGVGVLLAELAGFMFLAKFGKFGPATGLAIIELAIALQMLQKVVEQFSGMSINELAKGLTAIGVSLGLIVVALKFMPKNAALVGIGLLEAAFAINQITTALKEASGMKWEEIGKGIVAIAGSLTVLAIALHAMKSSLSGAAALIVAAAAMAILTPQLVALGSMKLTEIGKSLLMLASTFTVIGVAGALLAPVIPAILGLSAAVALLGVGVLACSAGVLALSAALVTLAGASAATVAAALDVLEGIFVGLLQIVTRHIKAFAELIKAFVLSMCDVMVACAPTLAETLLTVLESIFGSLANHTPKIIDYFMTFLIGVINGIASRMPELVHAAFNLFGAFFSAIADELNAMDMNNFINGIKVIGFMTAFIMACSAILPFIPGAMAGVIGLGLVVAEIALVLAAIGKLSEIPGLQNFIEKGGDFLQKIGTAIGQFIGGVVGGALAGLSASLPVVGANLSLFMTSATPFFDGLSRIDEGMIESAKNLAKVILYFTTASLIDGLTRWIGGGKSIVQFGRELASFGPYIKKFADDTAGITAESVQGASNAAMLLAKMASDLPNSGGLAAKIFGDNTLSQFGQELAKFGPYLQKYASSVTGISADVVTASANMVSMLSTMAQDIPNQGGFITLFTGDNTMEKFGAGLVKLGESLSKYSVSVANVDTGKLNAVIAELNNLVRFAKNVVGLDTSGMTSFSTALKIMATEGINAFITAFDQASPKALKCLKDLVTDLANVIRERKETYYTFFRTFGEHLMTSLANGINSKAGLARTAVEKAIEKIWIGANKQGNHDRMVEIGEYLLQGLHQGLTNAGWLGKIKDAAANAVTAAKVAAENAGKVNSPSRVFRAIGQYLTMGLALGISDLVDDAANASEEVAYKTINAMTTAVDMIQDAINADYDLSPTITPVIDMTNADAGLAQLDNMMGQRTITFGANANLATIGRIQNEGELINNLASAINASNDNTDVVDSINTLREDISELKAAMSNLRVIMDTGQLVGAISPGVNEALGQIALFEGRGM